MAYTNHIYYEREEEKQPEKKKTEKAMNERMNQATIDSWNQEQK